MQTGTRGSGWVDGGVSRTLCMCVCRFWMYLEGGLCDFDFATEKREFLLLLPGNTW